MRHVRRAAALGLLAALAAASRCAAAEPADPWREMWGYGEDPLWTKYEELFDEPFPARSFDWFHRMRPFDDVQAFDRAVDLRTAGVSSRVDETQAGVTLSISWPGSSEKPVDVTVDGGLVHLKPSPPPPEASSPYRFYAAGSRLISIAVPEHAKADTARVMRSGDTIRVEFDRR